jgi:hypothetical protein
LVNAFLNVIQFFKDRLQYANSVHRHSRNIN